MSHTRQVKSAFHCHWSPVPGTAQLLVTTEDHPAPVAIVWFRHILNNRSIEILNSFVVENRRRFGYRTEMNSWLFAAYPNVTYIVTQRGTRSGEKWMKAVGYKQVSGYWQVCRADWERKFGKWRP